MNWFAIYTKSHCEKAVSEKLALLGFKVYCPLLKTRKKWSDRWKWIEEPLFRSYCFIQIANEERDKVFSVQGVVRYLYFCGRPAIIRQQEIDTLRNWVNEYSHDRIENVSYGPKDKVTLKSGALINQSAEVIEYKGNYILLNLGGIGFNIKVDLRNNIVEKCRNVSLRS